MRNLLNPNLYVNSIYDINLLELKEKGIESIIVDIDNTLISWDCKLATREVVNWFKEVKQLDFNICIVSNATKSRVIKFNENVKVNAIHRAIKPRKKPFEKAIKLMGTKSDKTAVIGDQLFTDILGGNRIGAYTILVTPISTKEFIWTKLIRRIEKFILNNKMVVRK